MNCRICNGSSFTQVLDLGSTPLADDFLTAERLNEPETYYPLRVVLCAECHLAQLTYTVPREQLYGPEYPYVSSTTETGRAHYQAMALSIVQRFNLNGGLAVDIGSNVGVLLDGFWRCGMQVLGIEPVQKIADAASLAGINTLATFFSADVARSIVAGRKRALVVTATNVVAHIDDLHDLAAGIAELLAPGGIFVFEAPYLGDLIEQRAYDTIYHEHLSYLSIEPVMRLLSVHGLELFDVERQSIHGGTLRYFVAARGEYAVSDRLREMADAETRLYREDTLLAFASDVALNRAHLCYLLRDEAWHGHRIAAVSAPAKGMTLLNANGIGRGILDFATEKAPLKIGRFTPGGHLPVLGDEALLERQPDFALLLAWNFAAEIMANLQEYRDRGGRFIVPIPSPTITDSEMDYEKVRALNLEAARS